MGYNIFEFGCSKKLIPRRHMRLPGPTERFFLQFKEAVSRIFRHCFFHDKTYLDPRFMGKFFLCKGAGF